MRLIHKGDESVVAWGLTASCLSCGAVFEIGRNDILLDHLQIACDDNEFWNTEWMEASPLYYGSMRKRIAIEGRIGSRKQMCRDACYYAKCPTCFGYVYLEYKSVPEYVRTYVEAIREPTRKSDWLTRANP